MQMVTAEAVDAELKKRWRDRPSSFLLALYRERSETHQVRGTRITAWSGITIYVAFALLDAFLIPDVLVYTAMARIIVGVLSISFVEWRIWAGDSASRIDTYCAAFVVFAYSTWLGLASLSVHAESVSYYMTFGTIFMMVLNLFFNFSFRKSFIASTLVLLAYVSASSLLFSLGIDYLVAIGTLYVSSYFLTLYVNWKLNAERYRVFLNAVQAEIRQAEVDERSAALLRLSNTDALTGLSNRRAIDAELRRYWDDWQTLGNGFAIILTDIDFFKRFNDHYGHQQGDRCLAMVADALSTLASRRSFSVGRFGGEEFIVLARATNVDGVARIAEEIRFAIESLRIAHEQRPDGEGVVTVSVGAAFSQGLQGEKVEKLVSEADRALYGAKASGRNYARVFDREDPQRNDDSENISALLKNAIAGGFVSLAYQPVVDVRSGTIRAAEALMRLKMPNGKSISPAVFIPLAEQSGAILELGRWAIRTACREMISGNVVPTVSVNVSAVQLKSPGFSMSVAAILGELDIAPGRLAFEVTEGLEIESDQAVRRCIGELRQIGVQIWLDDFGTGFAGLSCLREIEFDIVKIDRSFLHDSSTVSGAAMLQDIIRLIENRGLQMIVEGVENKRQQHLLKSYGVELIQGFHVARPMTADAMRSELGQPAPALTRASSH